MNADQGVELFGNIIGLVVLLGVTGWVRVDARRRGFSPQAAFGWSVGVFLLLIVFLPLYLWARRGKALVPGAPLRSNAPLASVPCRYCGYENAGDPDYCAKCGRQLRSSTEIHR